MKTKLMKKTVIISSLAGITLFLGVSIVGEFFIPVGSVLNIIGLIGAVAVILPFFLLQFIFPLGLLDAYGADSIPFWGKMMFYIILFPFVDMLALAVLDAIWHFLPDFHLAMEQGADRATVYALRQEWREQGWAIIAITYIVMVGAGLIFRGIFWKKLMKLAAE